MPPAHTPASASAKASAAAARGSSPRPQPRPRTAGTSRSRESAWSTRGAARSEPSALERHAAHTPSSTSAGQRAHWRKSVGSEASAGWFPTKRKSATGTAM